MTIYCSLHNHSMYYDHFLFCLTFVFDYESIIVVGQLSHVQLFVTPWTAAHQAFLAFTISQSLLKLIFIELVMMPSNHLILCHLLFLLPSVFLSIRVISNESALCFRWPKYWSFSFSISPSNEYSGLISFRISCVQGTLRSLLQHHSSKAPILWHSAFFVVQLSHPYMTTGKTTALTMQTFVSKVMSLLFNTLSRFVIALVPRSNCLLILWLQSPFAVILEPEKIKSVTVNYLTLKFNPFAYFSRYLSLSYPHSLQQGYKMLLHTVKVFFSPFTHP